MRKPSIGFIGQGFIGKNYADDFKRRGFTVVRYGLEEPYIRNREKLRECDIVFIAVPTPTTPKGFDASAVEDALTHIPKGAVAVIKSTLLPGTTKRLQQSHPGLTILFSPEFLSVATAAEDATHPAMNIVGLPVRSKKHASAAARVHAVLPKAPFKLTCSSDEAEVFKYTHNLSGYAQVLLFNLMYDWARSLGCDWSKIESAVLADPFISNRYARPIHKSGRGAGGACFIKDMAAARGQYERLRRKDKKGIALLRALEAKNIELLAATRKDLGLLRGVYGSRALKGR